MKQSAFNFGPWKQLEKFGKEPLMAGNDLIQMSNVVRYLGQIPGPSANLQQPHQPEGKGSNGKLHMNKVS